MKNINLSVFVTILMLLMGIGMVEVQNSRQLNLVRLSPGGTYGDENLIGEVNKEGFSKTPYSEWFEKNYTDYYPNSDILKKIKPFLKISK